MATFNILSSCICRDAFGMQEKIDHELIHFLQSSSPITWFRLNDKPKTEINEELLSGVTTLRNFQKRCIINDYNKTVLDFYETKADLFVTDLVSFASSGLVKLVHPDNTEHYFTHSKWFENAYNHGLKEHLQGELKSVNRFKLIDDELISTTVSKYIDWILSKGYTPDEVILVENKKVSWYSDGEVIYYFDYIAEIDKVNAILDRVYAEFERRMPDCHIIKMPTDTFSDANHKWSLSSLHYCQEYYDYLYKCFDLIATKGRCDDEIRQLRDYYSNWMSTQKDKFVINTLKNMNNKNYLDFDLCEEAHGELIAPAGITFYKTPSDVHVAGTTKKYIKVTKYNYAYASFVQKDKTYYVNIDDCVKGVSGASQNINDGWETVNSTTVATIKNNSVVIGHNGSKTNAQTQIIQIINGEEDLAGKLVTLSVYARVHSLNNNRKGGCIGIINSKGYNKGVIYAKTEFKKSSWSRIKLSVRLPEADELEGVTVILRAIAGSGDEPRHAVVEFSQPKLELGSFCTN